MRCLDGGESDYVGRWSTVVGIVGPPAGRPDLASRDTESSARRPTPWRSTVTARLLLPDMRQQKVHGAQPRLAHVPSYREGLEIGVLRPRRAPEEVMDVAVVSRGAIHVDATDLKVRDRTPLILVRFTVPAASEREEDLAAEGVARFAREAVDRVAVTGAHRLLRRCGGDWVPVS